VRIGLQEIGADKFSTILILDEERGKHDLEKMQAKTP
jgi:hypothetical protein